MYILVMFVYSGDYASTPVYVEKEETQRTASSPIPSFVVV
jgi:hypothetical protein